MKTGRHPSAARRTGIRRELFLFYGAAALALIVVAIGAVIASRSVAQSQALTESEGMTTRMADLVLGPLLLKAMDGGPKEHEALVSAIEHRMKDGYLREVVVWDAAGNVIFADDPDEIGEHTSPPPPEVTAAIKSGAISSDFEDEPEITSLEVDENSDGFVEVYVPLDMPGKPPLAFEAYYDYARVNDNANNLMAQLVPLVLVPLVVLMIILVPIAVSLSRRIRRNDAERAALLEHSLSVSEKERIRIAADLHDGPIQELAGIGYALGSVATSVPERQWPLMQMVQETVLKAIDSLRRLMVDLYPPDLSVSQLPAALSDLAEPLNDHGVEVSLNVDPLPEMDIDVVTTIYRVAHEALANVTEHARAAHVSVRLETDRVGTNGEQCRAPQAIVLSITDDGIGVDPNKLDRRSDGHLGLRLLMTRVEDLGGILTVSVAPQGGTEVRAWLPLDPDLVSA